MQNRKDQIAQTLATRVADGTYAEGSTLPNQVQLGAEFGASRNTISSAKWLLTAVGVIKHGGRKGTQVPDGGRAAALKVLDGPLFR